MATLAEINFEYIENAKRGKGKLRCLVCDRRYKKIGNHLDEHSQEHVDKGEKIMDNKSKNFRLPLTQEEFDKIKDMLFRGEEYPEIAQATGRSGGTISRIEKAQTLVEYSEKQKEAYNVREEKRRQGLLGGRPKEQKIPKMDHYRRLAQMREELDTVLADFLIAEISQHQQDLLRENATLKSNLDKLQRLYDGLNQELLEARISKPSGFSEKLRQRMEEKNGKEV